ncbi:MAG: hypothetical protein ACJAX4_003220 [Clostridium sp.]|jgi:hypothetical protein
MDYVRLREEERYGYQEINGVQYVLKNVLSLKVITRRLRRIFKSRIFTVGWSEKWLYKCLLR